VSAAAPLGTPRTPAAAGAAGSPAGGPVAAAAAAALAQPPGQVAAALQAQGKSYEDVVHLYADMVSVTIWHDLTGKAVFMDRICHTSMHD